MGLGLRPEGRGQDMRVADRFVLFAGHWDVVPAQALVHSLPLNATPDAA